MKNRLPKKSENEGKTTKAEKNVKNVKKEKKQDKEKIEKTNKSEKKSKLNFKKIKTEKNQSKNDSAKMTEKAKTKSRLKRNIVIAVLAIAVIVMYVIQRGEYLEIKEIGENYIPIFWKNFRDIAITTVLNFSVVFGAVFFTTKEIKKCLKDFFEDEEKEFPKLPQKSISFIIATLVTIFTSHMIMNKALICFNNTQFVITDPALGHDIGFYVFILPFIKMITIYILILFAGLAIYSALYYLIIFNFCFNGINRETVKKSKLLNQALLALKAVVVAFAFLVLVETQNIGVQKFITLNSNESLNYALYGAGATEIYIRYIAYIILSLLIIFSVFRAVAQFKKGNTRKIVIDVLIVPIYLFAVIIIMIGYNLVFINSNELDKEKKYISENIKYTKMGYDIDIEDVQVADAGTISEWAINENEETVYNIPTVNSDMILKDLNTSMTNDDHYKYTYTNKALYSIDDENKLIFVTPREIESDDSEYSNKTYEFTHGYGAIITAANGTNSNGTLNHIQKEFENTDEAVVISEPRIYFGRKTNSIVVTNSNSKKEFDYPLTTAENAANDYNGKAGLSLNLIDRIVLAIKEKDAKLALSGGVKSDSKILTNRNVINRAKTIMPYLMYDSNPYLVIRNNGELVWVIDAYTTSNNFPYSQRTILTENVITKTEINYIRNSVKVIINAYSGEVVFYMTDKEDPIAAAYKNIYPTLFATEEIPEDISCHLTYPGFLYDIQSKIIERYHNIEADDLYRSDDVWEMAAQNTTQILSKTGTQIKPYFTMVKTKDSNTTRLGLVLPYTPYGKQNITAFLIGSVDENGNNILKTYTYSKDSIVVGPMQLDSQIAIDETISKELETLNVPGTKLSKNIVIVPINNSVIYVETIYQQYVNDPQSVPVLKKVIVASGSKVTIGDTFAEALKNLVSQNAVDIEVENADDIMNLVDAVIRANNNLKESTQSGDWSQMGKDTQKLQDLISRLEELKLQEDEKKAQEESEIDEEENVEIN